MKYKTFFSFDFYRADGGASSTENLPVAMMMVDGGASRRINFSSTDDISLISELEQARSFKNIILYLSSTKDHKDMKAAMNLTEIANAQTEFVFVVTVERFSGGKLLEGFELFEMSATLKFAPVMALNNTLMVSINLPFAELTQGKIQKHQLERVTKQL